MIFDDCTGKILPHPVHYMIGKPVQYVVNRFIDGVTCACMLINKGVYKSAGGLSIEYDDVYQDVDFNLKLRKDGYEIYLTNSTHMLHKENASRNEGDAQTRATMLADANTFQEKWSNKVFVKDSKRGIVNRGDAPVFSFVTLITDEREYGEFLDSVKTDITHEFVGIKNYNNFFDSSMPQIWFNASSHQLSQRTMSW